MSKKPTLEELREQARVNYGITNADDLDEKRLKEEMRDLDKQAEVAAKEQKDVTRNPDRAASNSTVPPTVGASDGNTASVSDEESDENSDGDEEKPLSKQTKDELLETAKAENVEVEETDTVPVLREKIAAHREGDNSDEDDQSDEQE